MHKARRNLNVICAILLVLTILSGCTPGKMAPITDSYEYSTNNKNYVQPAVVDGWAKRDALTATTADGTFFCFTTDTAQADDFINA